MVKQYKQSGPCSDSLLLILLFVIEVSTITYIATISVYLMCPLVSSVVISNPGNSTLADVLYSNYDMQAVADIRYISINYFDIIKKSNCLFIKQLMGP